MTVIEASEVQFDAAVLAVRAGSWEGSIGS
jgi:hypothetical protein